MERETPRRRLCQLFLLAAACLACHLCRAEHHPYCDSLCAGQRQNRMGCFLNCEQELSGIFFRAGRPSYVGLVPGPAFGGGDEWDGGPGEPIEIPMSDVLLREPRDRSAFVRIGKRDVSAVTKRRDEFVRIGKGMKPMNRSPFLLGRSYNIKGQQQSDDQTNRRFKQSTADDALVIPVAEVEKRPSAFVRIGKRQDDASEANPQSSAAAAEHQMGGNLDENGGPVDEELVPVTDEAANQLDKRASAFVRIGRKTASFVRIGKSESGE